MISTRIELLTSSTSTLSTAAIAEKAGRLVDMACSASGRHHAVLYETMCVLVPSLTVVLHIPEGCLGRRVTFSSSEASSGSSVLAVAYEPCVIEIFQEGSAGTWVSRQCIGSDVLMANVVDMAFAPKGPGLRLAAAFGTSNVSVFSAKEGPEYELLRLDGNIDVGELLLSNSNSNTASAAASSNSPHNGPVGVSKRGKATLERRSYTAVCWRDVVYPTGLLISDDVGNITLVEQSRKGETSRDMVTTCYPVPLPPPTAAASHAYSALSASTSSSSSVVLCMSCAPSVGRTVHFVAVGCRDGRLIVSTLGKGSGGPAAVYMGAAACFRVEWASCGSLLAACFADDTVRLFILRVAFEAGLYRPSLEELTTTK
eukprot:PhM_4_TR2176/c0_g1_i1/m.12942